MSEVIKFPSTDKATPKAEKPSSIEEIEKVRNMLAQSLAKIYPKEPLDLEHSPESEAKFKSSESIKVTESRSAYANSKNPVPFVDDKSKAFIFKDKKTGERYRVCFPYNEDGSVDLEIRSTEEQVLRVRPSLAEFKKQKTPKLRIV